SLRPLQVSTEAARVSAVAPCVGLCQLVGQISRFHVLDMPCPENTGVARYTPLALGGSRLELINDPGAALLKIVEKVPVGLQPRHSRQGWEPGRCRTRFPLLLQRRIWPDAGGDQGHHRPWDTPYCLLNLVPGLQIVWTHHVHLGFFFVGQTAFDNLLEGCPWHTTEVTPGHNDKVRVELHLGVHRRLELADHLLDGDAAAAWPRLRWEGLVLNVTSGDAGVNILLDCTVRIDRVAVA